MLGVFLTYRRSRFLAYAFSKGIQFVELFTLENIGDAGIDSLIADVDTSQIPKSIKIFNWDDDTVDSLDGLLKAFPRRACLDIVSDQTIQASFYALESVWLNKISYPDIELQTQPVQPSQPPQSLTLAEPPQQPQPPQPSQPSQLSQPPQPSQPPQHTQRFGRIGRKQAVNNVWAIVSNLPRAGVSTAAFALARYQAEINKKQVLLVDLNLCNSNDFSRFLPLSEKTSATVMNAVTLDKDTFSMCKGLYTAPFGLAAPSLSVITFGDCKGVLKATYAQKDYCPMINMLASQYDLVILDLGMLQDELSYMQSILANVSYRSILIVPGNTHEIMTASALGYQRSRLNEDILVTQFNPNVSLAPISKLLTNKVLGAIETDSRIQDTLRMQEPLRSMPIFSSLENICKEI